MSASVSRQSIFSCSSVLTSAAKRRHDLGILRVAQEGDARHRQVMLDQEGHRLPRLRRQLQPLHHRLGHDARSRQRDPPRATCRRRDRAAPGRSSSGACTSPSIAAKRSRAGDFGGAQRLDVADRQQRVLVDRVAMVEVADHAGVDLGELREDAGRAARSRASRTGDAYRPGRGTSSAAHLLAVAFGGHEIVGGVAVDVLLDAGPGLLGDRAVLRRARPGTLRATSSASPRRARGSTKRTPSAAISR